MAVFACKRLNALRGPSIAHGSWPREAIRLATQEVSEILLVRTRGAEGDGDFGRGKLSDLALLGNVGLPMEADLCLPCAGADWFFLPSALLRV